MHVQVKVKVSETLPEVARSKNQNKRRNLADLVNLDSFLHQNLKCDLKSDIIYNFKFNKFNIG